MNKLIEKIINNSFVKDTGLIAKSKIYYYEGKPYVGYIVYQTYKFFWFTRYVYHGSVHELEELVKEYPNIKIVY